MTVTSDFWLRIHNIIRINVEVSKSIENYRDSTQLFKLQCMAWFDLDHLVLTEDARRRRYSVQLVIGHCKSKSEHRIIPCDGTI